MSTCILIPPLPPPPCSTLLAAQLIKLAGRQKWSLRARSEWNLLSLETKCDLETSRVSLGNCQLHRGISMGTLSLVLATVARATRELCPQCVCLTVPLCVCVCECVRNWGAHGARFTIHDSSFTFRVSFLLSQKPNENSTVTFFMLRCAVLCGAATDGR